MQEELTDIEELQIKGELVGMENESFNEKTAFVFDEDNTIEIIEKIKKLIGLDNSQNHIIVAIKEAIEIINTSIIAIEQKDDSQDTALTTLETSLSTLNELVTEIQSENGTQDDSITEINTLLETLETNLTTATNKITNLEEALANVPSDVTEFADYITSIQKTMGIYFDTYSNSKTYSIDDIVVFNHNLYACTSAITTPEEFNETKWEFVPFLIEESEEEIE